MQISKPGRFADAHKRSSHSATNFSIVLGLAGLGQTWRVSAILWGLPHSIGEYVLLAAGLVWAWLVACFVARMIQVPKESQEEFRHPVQGAAPALIGIATLLLVPAVQPYSLTAAYVFLALGLSWHLIFALWHTGVGWRVGHDASDTAPTIYLPTVAGNFTAGAALGALGIPDIGWLFVGAGFFSWLALESLVMQRLLHTNELPVQQRATVGIQFAPPVVAGTAWLAITPGSTDHWILMLWGYGLFQLMLGFRLFAWLRAQPFSRSYWSYTFGASSAALICVKLAVAGVPVAKQVAPVLFILVNFFEIYLVTRMIYAVIRRLVIRVSEALAMPFSSVMRDT